MSEYIFPSNPSDGDTVTVSNITYTWDNTGGYWVNNVIGQAGTGITIAGDSGASNTVTVGTDTLTFEGGSGINTVISNDKVTFNLADDFASATNSLLSAVDIVSGTDYVIKTLGNTNWTSLGATAVSTVNNNALTSGTEYIITDLGTADSSPGSGGYRTRWTVLGADNTPAVGEIFVAESVDSAGTNGDGAVLETRFTASSDGSGTGTVMKNAVHYVTFVDSLTGTSALLASSALTYNPGTGYIQAGNLQGSFFGDFSGTVKGTFIGGLGADVAAAKLNVATRSDTDDMYFILADGFSGVRSVEAMSSLKYNHSTTSLQAPAFTDGTATLTGGALTGMTGAITTTGTITGGTLTDGTASISSGAITGATNITASGIVSFGTLTDSGESIAITKFVDEADGISSNDNDTTIPTSAAVKAYVDSQVTAQDLDFQADSGGALSIDLDSEVLTFTGSTGITTAGSGNAVTFAIDSTVATLTGTQTLTNKTLTSPTISTDITVGASTISETELQILDGATVSTAELNKLDGFTGDKDDLNYAKDLRATEVTAAEFDHLDGVTSNLQTQLDAKAPSAGASLTGTTSFETLSDGSISITAFVDEDDMSSDSATLIPTQQSVKAYVDSQTTAPELQITDDNNTTGLSVTVGTGQDTLKIAGGAGIETSGSGQTITVNMSNGVLQFAADTGTAFSKNYNETVTVIGTTNEIETSIDSNRIKVGLPDDVEITGTLTTANLIVSGTSTTVNTETVTIADNILLLNSNETGTPSQNAGIEIERGTSPNKQFIWDEGNDRWTLGGENLVANSFIGDVTGDITGTVSSIANHSTTNLSEGTNLYFTNARVDSHLSGGIGVDYSSGVISIGQAVATTSNVQFNQVTAALTGDVTGDLTGNVTGNVTGDLTGDVYASDGTTKILESGNGVSTATFTGDVTGDLTGTADKANTFAVTTNTSTDSSFFPVFTDGTTATEAAVVDSGLTYNPATGTLSAENFSGNFSGSASSATGVAISENGSDSAVHYITFVNGTDSSRAVRVDNKLQYKPSTNTIFSSDDNLKIEANLTGTASRAETVDVKDSDGTSATTKLLFNAPSSDSLGTLSTVRDTKGAVAPSVHYFEDDDKFVAFFASSSDLLQFSVGSRNSTDPTTISWGSATTAQYNSTNITCEQSADGSTTSGQSIGSISICPLIEDGKLLIGLYETSSSNVQATVRVATFDGSTVTFGAATNLGSAGSLSSGGTISLARDTSATSNNTVLAAYIDPSDKNSEAVVLTIASNGTITSGIGSLSLDNKRATGTFTSSTSTGSTNGVEYYSTASGNSTPYLDEDDASLQSQFTPVFSEPQMAGGTRITGTFTWSSLTDGRYYLIGINITNKGSGYTGAPTITTSTGTASLSDLQRNNNLVYSNVTVANNTYNSVQASWSGIASKWLVGAVGASTNNSQPYNHVRQLIWDGSNSLTDNTDSNFVHINTSDSLEDPISLVGNVEYPGSNALSILIYGTSGSGIKYKTIISGSGSNVTGGSETAVSDTSSYWSNFKTNIDPLSGDLILIADQYSSSGKAVLRGKLNGTTTIPWSGPSFAIESDTTGNWVGNGRETFVYDGSQNKFILFTEDTSSTNGKYQYLTFGEDSLEVDSGLTYNPNTNAFTASGAITGGSFVKSGGASTSFLMADGTTTDISSGKYAISITGDAGTLEGNNAAYYRNADNINAGTLASDRLPELAVSDFAGSAIQTSAELSSPGFADNDTTLLTAAAIDDRITSFGYTTNVGDITGVTAGAGLTGGGSSGGVTLAADTAAVTNGASTLATGDQIYDFVIGQGYTTNVGDITNVIAGTGISGGGASGDVTLNLDLSELTAATVSVANDSIVIIDADDSNASRKESIVDFVAGIAGSGLTAASGQLSLTGSLGVSNFAAASILEGGETFADNDTTLLTAAAIKDYVQAAFTHSNHTAATVAANGEELRITVTASTNLTLQDSGDANSTHYITMASDATGSTAIKTDGGLTYNASTNTLTASSFSGSLSGNASTATTLANAINIGGVSFDGSTNIDLPGVNTTGNQNTTGSAATLTTARTIGGVSFDGSAPIDLPGVNTTGNQNTTGSAATLTTARTIGGVSFDGSAPIDLPGVNTTGNQNTTGSAATLTTARTIGGVSFDGSAPIDLPGVNTTGNQNTTGSAATLTTARDFSLTGDATATAVSFNGSDDVQLSVTLKDDVNSNTGQVGSSTTIPVITTNAKGLVTAVGSATIQAAQNLEFVDASANTTTPVAGTDSFTIRGTSGSPITATVGTNVVNIDIADSTAGANAGAATLGAASFNSSDFTVSSGFVTIKNQGVSNAQLANSTITVSDSESTPNTSTIALGSTLTFAGTTNETTVLQSGGTVTIGLPDDVTLGGSLTVQDLTVNGTTTTISTTNMVVEDSLIELGNGTTGSPANDAGLVIERGSSDNAFIGWDESADKFLMGTGSFTGASTGNLTVTTGTLVANLEGDVTGDITGDVTGDIYASNGTSKILEAGTDGTDAILTGAASKVQHEADNTTNATMYIPFLSSQANSSTGSVIKTDSDLFYNPSTGRLTAGNIQGNLFGNVTGNVTGNITGNVNGTITGTVSGNAGSATILQNARDFTVGDTTISFDGSSNVDLTEGVQDTVAAMFSSNTENGSTITYDDNDGTLDITTTALYNGTSKKLEATSTGVEVTGHIVPAADVTYDLGSSTKKFRDLYLSGTTINLGDQTIQADSTTVTVSGTLSATNISGNLTGNVTGNAGGSAATLTTSRNFTVGSGIHHPFDGSADIDLTESIQDLVGAMFSNNTESGITVTYDDTDGTIDLSVSGGGGSTTIDVGTSAPSSPSNGQLWWDSSDLTPYIYYTDGSSNQWVEFVAGGGGGSGNVVLNISASAPSNPSSGQIWWDSTDLTPYIYYNDGSSAQWVEFVSGGAGNSNIVADTSPQLGGDLDADNNNIDNAGVITAKSYKDTVFTITDGASVDIDPDNGGIQVWTLGANRTPTANNFDAGAKIMLMINDGAGYTITWPSVNWVGGSAPTLATSGYSVIDIWKVGSQLYGLYQGAVA